MVIVVSIGAVLAINNAQVKASNTQIIIDNIRFALEFITKEMRSGSGFATSSCAGALCSQINFIHYLAAGGTEFVEYCLKDSSIHRYSDPVSPPDSCNDPNAKQPITSDDIVVDSLSFFLWQNLPPNPDPIQPRITVSIKARSTSARFPAEFNLETSVVQRLRQ